MTWLYHEARINDAFSYLKPLVTIYKPVLKGNLWESDTLFLTPILQYCSVSFVRNVLSVIIITIIISITSAVAAINDLSECDMKRTVFAFWMCHMSMNFQSICRLSLTSTQGAVSALRELHAAGICSQIKTQTKAQRAERILSSLLPSARCEWICITARIRIETPWKFMSFCLLKLKIAHIWSWSMREASGAVCSPVVWSDRAVSGGAGAPRSLFTRKAEKSDQAKHYTGMQDWKWKLQNGVGIKWKLQCLDYLLHLLDR